MAVKKYIKFDSEKGYLENKEDINYFSTNQMRKVAFGKMLGDFDENGLYVINSKIVDELIRMPKVIVEIIEGADLIRSTVKADSFFHFILTVEDNKAQFKLLEKIHYQSNRDFNSGLYSNINEYVLDEVIVTDRDFDRNALYQKYNISTENNGEALSIFDMDELSIALYYNITEKLKVNYLVQNTLMMKEKQLEQFEADYFEGVLTALSEFKDFDKKVTDGVKKDLVEKHTFVIASKPFFQHTVNEVMDSYVEMFIQDLSPEQRKEFEIRYRQIKGEYYERFKKLIPIEISQKSGVRFDANQILQEGVIGSLVQEIKTKGFTSSDVRKIVINEDELQLPVSKIRDMVQQNEEIAKRDNARAKDILRNRPQTTKLYRELEKESNVEVLTDKTLIEEKIESQHKVEEQKNTQKSEVKAETKTEKNQEKESIVKGEKTERKNNNVSSDSTPKATEGKKEAAKTEANSGARSSYSGSYDSSSDYDYNPADTSGKRSNSNSRESTKTNTQQPQTGKNTKDSNLKGQAVDFLLGLVGGDTTNKTAAANFAAGFVGGRTGKAGVDKDLNNEANDFLSKL